MKDHKVVAMPKPESLERLVNVAEFKKSQDRKEPPKLISRRPIVPGGGQTTKRQFNHSKSPRRRRLSNSRDIVQEVYDRMGVNYVRGQNSAELSVKATGVSTEKAKQSSPYKTQSQSLSVETRNDATEEDRDERKSVRSTRSVKSLMSAFGGGKSVASAKSVANRNVSHGVEYVDTTPGDGVREKIIDCRDDGDMDGTMSLISLDESQWTNRRQQQMRQEEEREPQASRGSFQNSKPSPKATLKPSNGNSSAGFSEEMIDKIIEERLQAKVAELESAFEEKLRRLEEQTNRRLEELERKIKGSEKKSFPYEKYRL
jgi:hypothetical protein